eukprot:TRINITY_DN2928_c0_g2_i14.p1 TRINITY_DN2928_c0_g2~~TRINITY_DN2928_c0_g2_i14.p1  ORF type:complete len:431 (-),score=77.53 TRINITY_DN2928_c0_g2_i14:118-1410(-)
MLARWIGLDTFLCGLGMIVCTIIGFFLSSYETFVRSSYWYLVAVSSGIALLRFPAEFGIWFGFVVVVYLTSVWQVVITDLVMFTRPGKTLFFSGCIYCVGILCGIWSVAWCFVPEGTGGSFTRQRAPQFYGLFLATVGLAYMKNPPQVPSAVAEKKKNQTVRNQIWMNGQVLTALSLLVILLVFPSVYFRGQDWNNFDGHGVDTNSIKAMVWAVRFGYNNFGWPNFEDVGKQIQTLQANVISLVETDTMRPFNGNHDLVEHLQNHLHYYSSYGPSTMNDTWGCALLSAFPIVRVENVNLPSPEGEVACLIDATLDIGGKLLDVISVHFGNTQHFWDRRQQATEIMQRVRRKKAENKPTLWLGYLTGHPGSANYNRLLDAGLNDIQPTEWDRYCLYHFYLNLLPGKLTRIPNRVHQISDTEIQLAEYNFLV